MILPIILLFSIFLTINAEANCSIHNPCGSHGYCSELDDNITCSCKYWWEGQFCDQQSANGKEVIILGSLTAALIFIFYALKIGRIIYLKSKAPKKEKVKEISTYPKLKNVFVTYVKQTYPLKSLGIALLVIIIAAATLLIKWSLLKKIHNEVIDKYRNNEGIYFTSASVCEVFNVEYINLITFPVAVFVILVCIVVNQRASFMRDKCKGYGAPPMPLDFFSHIDRKFSMVVFALIANDLLEILNGDSNTKGRDIGILMKFVLRIFKVLLMGFRFYPILAGVYINSIITLVVATLYFWLHHSITTVEHGMCTPVFYPNHDDFVAGIDKIYTFLKYFGDGNALLTFEICIDIPKALCLSYITVKLPLMLIKKIREHRNKNTSTERKMCDLLTREETHERPRSQTLFGRLIPKPGESLDDAVEEEKADPVPVSLPLPDLVNTYAFAVALTLTIMIIQLTILLANIRRNLLQAFRGDDSEIPRRHRANYLNYALGNFHFAGYFIGFLVWGFAIIAIFSTIISAFVGALFIFDKVKIMELIITSVTPPLLLFLFKKYLNLFLAQYVFLQDFGDVLAMDNRRFLMIFLYFNFYLDAFLGLISSIFRLIFSVIGGIIYMCRLDYSTLGRKLEMFDGGFNAYYGFIHTEFKKKQYIASHDSEVPIEPIEEKAVQQRKSSRYLRKWRLAAYLVRNPAIVFFRKTFLKKLTLDDLRAINDHDNDKNINVHRGAVFYTRQMAAQNPDFIQSIDSTQILIQRF
ncbi:hypothetical protein I4U23_030730 [Adineta vaga]|nr:hypothetical protein I4U23_030730 [Adineta vaga]